MVELGTVILVSLIQLFVGQVWASMLLHSHWKCLHTSATQMNNQNQTTIKCYCSNYKDGLILTYPSLSCSRTRKPVILSLSACTEFHLLGMGSTTTPAAFPAS